MKHLRTAPSVLIALLALLACVPEGDPPIDEATVLDDNTSVRIDATSSARTLFTLDAGNRVSIIEKRGTWYRIRDADLIEGWMDESTVIRDTTREAMERALAEAAAAPVQNTVRAREAVNLRLDPGRDTDIIRRLRRGTTMEVLDRATTPRPDSDATDIWLRVRPSPGEIGWVYARLVEFEVPEPIRPYTEGRIYPAVHTLKESADAVGQSWYLVAERRPETEPALAYDGIRVFVWNSEEEQYETTLRLRNLRGVFPVELAANESQAGFRFTVLADDGTPQTREFVMRGTLPREVR